LPSFKASNGGQIKMKEIYEKALASIKIKQFK